MGNYPAWLPRAEVLGRLPPTLLESRFLKHKLRKHTGPTVYLGRQPELRNDAAPLLSTTLAPREGRSPTEGLPATHVSVTC